MVIKEQIMLTAFDLFSEHGIKNVSMDDNRMYKPELY